MSYSRYETRQKFINKQQQYSEHFQNRDVRQINQYSTAKFNYLDPNKISKIQTYTHIWIAGDRLYKLAHEHYNNPELWWIIAWFNKKPTEAHFEIGEEIYIPKPLDEALKIMGV